MEYYILLTHLFWEVFLNKLSVVFFYPSVGGSSTKRFLKACHGWTENKTEILKTVYSQKSSNLKMEKFIIGHKDGTLLLIENLEFKK